MRLRMSSSDVFLLPNLSFNCEAPANLAGPNRQTEPIRKSETRITNRWIQKVFKSWTAEPTRADEPGPIECYACTQINAPAFHSTSCDRAHSPEWEAHAGSSLIPIQFDPLRHRTYPTEPQSWIFGSVLDPRDDRVHTLNRVFLLARALSLAVDPLFFYAFSVGPTCAKVNWVHVWHVGAIRTCVDLVHVWHVWMQLRVAYVSKESLVVGCGKLVWDPRMIAWHYVASSKGLWLDVLVVLPVPQVIFWLVVPELTRVDEIEFVMSVILMSFLLQFLPKVYHSVLMTKRIQKVIGYIFGTIWWGFSINLIAYFIASHVAGGCWYVLAIQRIVSCVTDECKKSSNCDLLDSIYSIGQTIYAKNSTSTMSESMKNIDVCFDDEGPFQYGIYVWAVPVVSGDSLAVKILYSLFWGLMTISTFGNILEPTSHWLEVIFSIITVLSGLMLFTLLIGNIQVFLHAVTARKRKMQIRWGDMEYWMRRRQLPSRLRHRVRRHQKRMWAATRGEDEIELIRELPQGLRRHIKRHLCVDLIKQMPLFHGLDGLVLDNICDRVERVVYSVGEKLIREGDPVQRMVFVVEGQIQRSQCFRKDTVARCILGPGNFFGDELLSWCLRRPLVDRLPASSATLECVEPTEAFALDATHMKYIYEHFRYVFANDKLERTARYYSANWRMWAAVNIQIAWRRHMILAGPAAAAAVAEEEVAQSPEAGGGDRRLRLCAAMFMSIRPRDHLQ